MVTTNESRLKRFRTTKQSILSKLQARESLLPATAVMRINVARSGLENSIYTGRLSPAGRRFWHFAA